MALLKFLKGNYSNLSTKAIAEGQILICGDTGEMFVDVAADKRVKIGDFVVMPDVPTLEALDASAVPTSRLYYVENGNILARSNGTSWIQINKQKTLAELGGVSKDTYDTQVAALVKADTDNATAISGVDTRLQAAEEKLKSVATTEGLAELTRTVEGHTALIDTINGDVNTAGSMLKIAKDAADAKDAAIEAAQNAADKAQGDVDTLTQTHATDKAALEGAIALKANAADVYDKDAIDGKVDTINGAIDLKANAADVYTKDDVDGMVDDLEAADLAINNIIGDVTEGKTVVEMIADAQSAASYDDEEVRGLIDTNAQGIAQEIEDRKDAVSGLKTDLEGQISDLDTAVATEKSRAEGVESGLRTDIDDIKADYLKAADKEALQTQINTIMNNPDTEGVINSINEFTQYIADHGEIAEGFRTDIDANAKAISDHETLAAQTYETKEDATAKYDELVAMVDEKAVQADWNQNDSEAADYIKNRPFYAIEGNKELVFEEYFVAENWADSSNWEGCYVYDLDESNFTEAGLVETDYYSLVTDDMYVVDWGGKEYTIKCWLDTYANILMSNGGYHDRETPWTELDFVVVDNHYRSHDIRVETKDKPSAEYIKIYRVITPDTLVQLDEKFIPDTIARTEDVDALAERMGVVEGTVATKAEKNYVDEQIQATNDAAATARTEITAEIATAKSEAITDAEGKIATAVDAVKADASNKDAVVLAEAQNSVNAAKTEMQGKIDTVSGALDTYKTENNAAVAAKADASAVYTKTEVEDMFAWGEF